MANLEKFSMLNPILDVSETFKKYFVMLGSSAVTNIQQPTSSYSNTNVNFNVVLPDNKRCVIDRSTAIVSIPVRLTFAGANGGSGNIYQPLREGLRADPLCAITQVLTINMNGNSISYQPYEQSKCMQRFNDNLKHNQIVPMMSDPVQLYTDAYNTNMSPFAARTSNPLEVPRSAYPITVNSNSTTAAEIDTVLYYNIFDFPPFTEQTDVVGINITPFTLNFNFISNLAHIWSRDPGHSQTLTSLTVTIGSNSLQSQPQISMNVLSLPDGMTIPPEISYPYHLTTFYASTTTSTIAQYATQTDVATQVIQLDSLPSKMYIYAKTATSSTLSTTALAVNTPDTFARIDKISITLGNKNNLLYSMKPQDIYTMSKRNGLNSTISFPDWIGTQGIAGTSPLLCGSIVCIDPARDLSLGENIACGVGEKLNFQALVSYTPLNPTTTKYDICTLFVYDGIQTMRGNQCELNRVMFSSVNELQPSPMSYAQMSALYGGIMAGDVKSFFKDALGKLKTNLPDILNFTNKVLKDTKALSRAATYIPYVGAPVSQALSTLGYGEGGDFYDGMPNDGGILAGGKVLKRSQLQKKLARRY